MDNNIDDLVLKLSKKVVKEFLEGLKNNKIGQDDEEVDSSFLLNLTLSTFVTSLINMMNYIKLNTVGEDKLFENIKLAQQAIKDAIKSLPFIHTVEETNV